MIGGRGRSASSSTIATAPGGTWVSATSVSDSGKRIQKDMSELNANPPPHCTAAPKGHNLFHWVATVIGPPDTPLTCSVARLYLADKAKHDEIAAEWMLRFAK
ncbi:Constitutive photomorphoproteinsis protein 10 [Hibiscus syriacus]|uniref:Constitutive photomorphoproteinsis protein 10 n=1 Tax=Hibiscus syriacus TaxID=106335 RepID=A0A6A3AR16_HIBSY|nr:Constitutive photomorphoproteinsis protein 10 [Hibiscus syriacus]